MSKSHEEDCFQDGSWTVLPSKLVMVIVFIVVLICTSSKGFAELRELKTLSLGQDKARRTVFNRIGVSDKSAMVVSALGDLFVFSSTPNGNLELSRIRNWSGAKSEISHLRLPDLFTPNDRHKFDRVDVQLLLTPDGRYVVCIGSAERIKTGRGNSEYNSASENVITVVHVESFTIGQTGRTSDLGLSKVRGYRLTSDGRIFVDGVAHPPKSDRVLVQLDLPSLQASPKCDYNGPDSKQGEDAGRIPVTNESCAQALSPSSFEQSLAPGPSLALSGFTCGKVPERLCPQPDHISPDQRFGIGIRAEGHDSMLRRWVWRGRAVVAFSAHTRSEIGEIDLTRNNVELQLSSFAGKDYLLLLWPGSGLTVYELREDESPSQKAER